MFRNLLLNEYTLTASFRMITAWFGFGISLGLVRQVPCKKEDKILKLAHLVTIWFCGLAFNSRVGFVQLVFCPTTSNSEP